MALAAETRERICSANAKARPRKMTELRAGVSLGGWTIVRLLASGGMGAVYVAKNSLSGVVRALKVVRPDLVANEDARQRFLREVALASRVRHPNVVEAYDPLEIDGQVILPMELLEGQTLAARLRRGPLEIAEAIELGIALARAAAACHAVGIIHRDLKPANVFLARDASGVETPKILDLGAAREIEGPKHTQTGHTIGSPSYRAPDTDGWTGGRRGGVAVYAVGVGPSGARTCTGPVEGEGHGSAIAKLVHGVQITSPRQLRPDIPTRLEHVVMRALAWDRAQRFESADALERALLEVRDAKPSPDASRPASAPTSAGPGPASVAPAAAVAAAPPVRRGRTAMTIAVSLLGAGLLALGAIAFGVVWYWSASLGSSTPGARTGPTPPVVATTAAHEDPGGAPPAPPAPSDERPLLEPDAGVAPAASPLPEIDEPRTRRDTTSRRSRSPRTDEADEAGSSGSGLWLEDPSE